MFAIQFGQSLFEVVVHKRNRQIGGTLHDANAELAQGRSNSAAHSTPSAPSGHDNSGDFFRPMPAARPKARPVRGDGARRRTRRQIDIPAIDKPCSGPLLSDRVENCAPAREKARESSSRHLAYRGRKSTENCAMKEELSVLGVEADDVGRQYKNRKIRRELGDVPAVLVLAGGPCHDFSMHALHPHRKAALVWERRRDGANQLLDRQPSGDRLTQTGRAQIKPAALFRHHIPLINRPRSSGRSAETIASTTHTRRRNLSRPQSKCHRRSRTLCSLRNRGRSHIPVRNRAHNRLRSRVRTRPSRVRSLGAV